MNARWQAEMAPFFERELRSSGSRRCSTLTEFAAIDLGASSGRVVCGRFDGGPSRSRSATASPNRPVRLPDGLRWNLLHLFTEAVGALRGRTLDGVGVGTWGVDYALLDERRRVLGLPFHYRDERTDGAARVAGLRGHRHPAHADQHRLPAAGRRSRRRGGARSRSCPTCSPTG